MDIDKFVYAFMHLKTSEIKLLVALLLFIVALACMFYNVFYNSATSTKVFYLVVSLALGRFSVVLLKKARKVVK